VIFVMSLFVAMAAQALACDHPYFPVKEGASWVYLSSSAGLSDSTMTQSESGVTDSSFTLTTVIDDFSQSINWACGPEGLTQMNYASNTAGFEFETINVSGITLPPAADWVAGKEWDSSYEVKGQMVQEGASLDVEGTVMIHQKIVGNETVTVAAGTFETVKVDSTFTMQMVSKVAGMSVPLNFSFNGSSYYVSGVGMVKSTGEGFSTELQSYTIP
jgi:hypothetical protein